MIKIIYLLGMFLGGLLILLYATGVFVTASANSEVDFRGEKDV